MVAKKRIRGTTPAIDAAALRLRREETRAEAILWQALRNRRLGGLRFRRQHPVGRFVLDFYCPDAKLVIELDGPVHEAQLDRDAARTAHLEAYGYTILRVPNEQVEHDLGAVLRTILATVPPPPGGFGGGGQGERAGPSPAPIPAGPHPSTFTTIP